MTWRAVDKFVFLAFVAGCGASHESPAPSPDASTPSEAQAPDAGTDARSAGDAGDASDAALDATADGASDASVLDASDASVTVSPLTHLTDLEYANTINDLTAVPPSQQTVALVPDDLAGGFPVGTAQSPAVVQAYHDSAEAVATLMVANLDTLLQTVGCGASSGASCAASFIDAFAPVAFRHGAVDAATVASLNQVFSVIAAAAGGATTSAGFQLGLQGVIEEILQSPYFLYHLEIEEEALGLGPVRVTSYSMANRLSYLLWGSMPDSTLLSASANAGLVTDAQVAAQATRMLADAKAAVGLHTFASEWLQPVPLPSTKTGVSTQITYTGTLSPTPLLAADGGPGGASFATLFTPALRQAIEQSFDAQVAAALSAPTGALSTLLTGTSIYVDATSAPLFGLMVNGATLQRETVDSNQRIGILSHPALMARFATSSTSDPASRAAFVWQAILCQPLPASPSTTPAFVAPATGVSLRQDDEMLDGTGRYAGEPACTTVGVTSDNGAPCLPLDTDGQPGACPSCHARLDPVGFLFETFDTMGDYRTIDDYGQPVDLGNLAVVQATDPSLDVATSDSVQLARNLAQSDQPIRCLASQLVRFMAHRADGPSDAVLESAVHDAFVGSNQNMSEAFMALTQAPIFVLRENVP